MSRNACRPLPLVSFQYGWWDTLALSTMSPFKAIHLSINIQVTIKNKTLSGDCCSTHISLSLWRPLPWKRGIRLPPSLLLTLLQNKTPHPTGGTISYIWRIDSELIQRQRHKIPQSSPTSLPVTSSTPTWKPILTKEITCQVPRRKITGLSITFSARSQIKTTNFIKLTPIKLLSEV